MRITGIRLTNWMRFRGDHEIELGPGVHAVVSEHDDDPARSNWGGKSAFLAAIRFALFGTVPTTTLDDAIHRGESELGVDLEMDDGTFVTRTKTRGKPVQTIATFTDPEVGEVELMQAAAQARIVELLRLSEDDFLATSFFAQKAAARFVLATPADRTEIVNGWLQLGPLEDAATVAGGVLQNALEDRASLANERLDLEQELRASGRDSFDGAIEDAEKALAEAKDEYDQRACDVEAWMQRERDRAEARGRREADERDRARRERAVRELQGLLEEKAALEAEKPDRFDLAPFEEHVASYRELFGTAHADCEEKKRLLCGEFGGTCPVNGRACPVADEINADVDQAKAAHEAAARLLDDRHRDLKRAESELREARDKKRATERRDEALARLAERIDETTRLTHELAEAASRAEQADDESAPEPKPPAPDAMGVARIEQRLTWLRKADGRYRGLALEIADAERRVATWRTASAILGRSGAQRRVAEGSLASIERAACARLSEAGIPLVVRCQWGRETKQLEKECRSCGTPYGARAKSCERCGAERRHKTDEKLHLDLSDRSGAAEDLGGLAFQLAAARWLRARRGSPWSVVVLDEPFGALDEHNRRALATSLTGLLADGFEQAFVVAHDRSTLDALPHRIRVVAHAEHSTLELG